MQIKFIAASLAVLSVRSALAGPIPALAQNIDLTPRSADPAAQPVAAAEPAIQAAQLTRMQNSAHLWAQSHINQIPSQTQLNNAHAWFPQTAFTQNTWQINDYRNNGWSGDVWYLYYLYWYYSQYAWQWNAYWPQQWNGWGYGYCTPGWNC